MSEPGVRREMRLLLDKYLAGDAGVGDFIDWEAGLSLDPSAGRLRGSMDRLALVAEEVADGLRGEREFRALALETLLREAPRSPGSAAGAAAQTKPIDRTIGDRTATTISDRAGNRDSDSAGG